MNRTLSSALVFALCCGASVALAEPRAVVRDFEGQNAKRIRGAVVSALEEHNVALVANADADRVASQEDLDLTTADGRVGVAGELQVTTFVEGNIERAGAKLRVEIIVYGGSDGAQIGTLKLTATKAAVVRIVKDRFWGSFGSGIQNAEAPPKQEKKAPEVVAAPEPVAEEEPEPVAKKEPEPDEDDDGFESKLSPLDITVGARFGNRDFAYKDALGGLRDYELGVSPSVALHLRWYPAAHVSNGFLANLGLDLRGEMLVGVKSKNSTGVEFPTSSTRLGLGMRVRVPLEENELGFLFGYSSHSFAIDEAEGVNPGVPDVKHGSLRMGADFRWMFAKPFSLQLVAAYLMNLEAGEIASETWFPHTSAGGVEAEAGIGFEMIEHLELQVAFEVERYFMSFHPSPTDVSVTVNHRVAGGAVDQFMSLRASVMWRM